MKLVVIGAEGTVGSAACNELAARHEIIKVDRNSGEIQDVSVIKTNGTVERVS